MAGYSIFFKRSAIKELKAIHKDDLQRIVTRIAALADDPRPRDGEKLSSQERYRIRQGNYRIIYSVHDVVLTIWVVKVGHRREVSR